MSDCPICKTKLKTSYDRLIEMCPSCFDSEFEAELKLSKEIKNKVQEIGSEMTAIQAKADLHVGDCRRKIHKLQKMCPHLSTHGDSEYSWCNYCGRQDG